MTEKKTPPLILRNPDTGRIDQDDADRVTRKVVKDLITTQRDFQKEMSFRNARTNRRDIVVKVIIYQRNTVNGMVVRDDSQNPLFEKLSDDPLDHYRYNYFEHIDGEVLVKEMPLLPARVGRWTMGMFKALTNYLARMGVFNGI